MKVHDRGGALGPSRTGISTRDAHSAPLRAGSALPLRGVRADLYPLDEAA